MVNPLGLGARRSWLALLASKSGLKSLRDEHSYRGSQSRVVGYVPEEELQECLAKEEHSYMSKNFRQLSRATCFAMLASHEALEDAKLLDNNHQLIEQYRNNCGVSIGQGMVDFQDIYENANLVMNVDRGVRKLSPYFMTRALINMSAGNVSIRYKILGPNHCVSTACASGAHSIGDAYNFIKYNKANIMVCGSTEAAINSLSMAGFDRLRALSVNFNDRPEQASRPFDEDRCGFVMSEGAGVVVLEELEHARARGIRDQDIYCHLLGYGTSADAHHLTAPHPAGSGAYRCMKSALEDANLSSNSLSHVNAHATSTPLGDDIECNAIEDLFFGPEKVDGSSPATDQNVNVSVTSCKGSIGHLLGGAGSVETIFSMLSCQQAILPHCLNLDKPLKTNRNLLNFIRGKPENWSSDKRILMKNSFGFGGTNASLVISAHQS